MLHFYAVMLSEGAVRNKIRQDHTIPARLAEGLFEPSSINFLQSLHAHIQL